jgi:hypothetical protein
MTTLSAGSLSVQYSKCRDRLSHTIGIRIGDSYMPLLESIEGSEEEPWPASPPMQQMVEECFTPGATPVLLGVGLSGNGHWSMAVETLDSKRLKFDVACKNSKKATWLGSQYRVLVSFQKFDFSFPNSILFDLEKDGDCRIEMRVSIGQLEVVEADQRLQLLPVSLPSELRTHRWCFEIGIFECR